MDTIGPHRIPMRVGSSRCGAGAFATEDLAPGAIVLPQWHESFYRGMEGWVTLSRREILGLPLERRELFFRYGLDEDFDRIVGPLHLGYVRTVDNFINHSCEPNLRYDRAGNVVTARDIRAGEELSIDYGCFIVNFDERFECRCGAADCRTHIRRNDWRKLATKYGFNMPRFLHSHIEI